MSGYSSSEVANLCHARTEAVEKAAALSSDDYQVRRILLQCCSLLGIKNLANIEDCRTLDVAEVLLEKVHHHSPTMNASIRLNRRCARCGKTYAEHTQITGYRCPGTTGSYEQNNWIPKEARP